MSGHSKVEGAQGRLGSAPFPPLLALRHLFLWESILAAPAQCIVIDESHLVFTMTAATYLFKCAAGRDLCGTRTCGNRRLIELSTGS